MRPVQSPRPEPRGIPDDVRQAPLAPSLKVLAYLSGIEPRVMRESWFADQARGIILVAALGFIFVLQWIIWSNVAAQIMFIAPAVMVGLLPPIGLTLFDRLVVLPALWNVSGEARAALNLDKQAAWAAAVAFALRVVVSLTFAWVAADYLSLVIEHDSLLEHRKASAKLGNQPLFDEVDRLKRLQYGDLVTPLVEQRARISAQIERLSQTREQAERNLVEAESASRQAAIEKGREVDGFSGDGQVREKGAGSLYREAQRQEDAARQQARLHSQRLADSQREHGQLQSELQKVERALAEAEETYRSEANRLELALPQDPRFIAPAADLMSLRIAMEELAADPVKGPIIRKHTVGLELIVLLLDLLLIFVKWAPHSGSYAVRLVAAQRIEIAEAVRDANVRIARADDQRPDIRIVGHNES